MAWTLLLLAGLFEVLWAFYMKQSNGFSELIPTAITILGMIASVVLLALSMKSLPLGTAYAVWTGIGTIGAFIIGLLVLGEPAHPLRLMGAGFILTGLLMMKFSI